MKNKQQEMSQLNRYLESKDITKFVNVTTDVLQDYHFEKLKRGIKPNSILSTARQI